MKRLVTVLFICVVLLVPALAFAQDSLCFDAYSGDDYDKVSVFGDYSLYDYGPDVVSRIEEFLKQRPEYAKYYVRSINSMAFSRFMDNVYKKADETCAEYSKEKGAEFVPEIYNIEHGYMHVPQSPNALKYQSPRLAAHISGSITYCCLPVEEVKGWGN